MDTLEETPIADISATDEQMTDEQFNSLYPKHPCYVSNYLVICTLRQCKCVSPVIPLFNLTFVYFIGANGY